MTERRASYRATMGIPAHVRVKDKQHTGRILDLSGGGALLQVEVEIAAGTGVTIVGLLDEAMQAEVGAARFLIEGTVVEYTTAPPEEDGYRPEADDGPFYTRISNSAPDGSVGYEAIMAVVFARQRLDIARERGREDASPMGDVRATKPQFPQRYDKGSLRPDS